ncbi:MAG: penicillin-binding protein 2 [candidate division Zixibacteria bacterium]|nr:penicillin-binding protein 2 [candidate division Zixibacteria bacterium]
MTQGTTSKQQRLIIGSLFCAFFIILLLGRMIYLQTFRYESLYKQSEKNRIRIQSVTPKRGIIFDREKRILVDNRASYTLSVVPVEIAKTETAQKLSTLLDLEQSEITRRIRKNTISRFQPALIKRDLGFEQIAILEEQNELFPGAVYRKDQVRLYKPDLSAECFTGYVGEISSEEIKSLDPSIYKAGRVIGKSGIEKQYDRELRGLEGTEYLEITASGQLLGVLEEQHGVLAEPGGDIVLTIDKDIQKAANESFVDFSCGAAVALDPRNGEILAIVSKPSNDANIFSSVIPAVLWQSILADTNNPLLNRPLNGLYPPASTYKLVIAGAGLELGLIDRNSVFPHSCTGGYRFGIRVFRCWLPAGHGKTNVVEAIERSCDVYFYQLGQKLGLEEFYKYSTACGFGRKTGIDLPQEASGNVPDREWYDKRIGKGQWTMAVILNLAIGQGEILSTPLQLAQFYCGLANKGRVYRPHLLKSIIETDGRETSRGGEFSFALPFSPETLEILNEGLVQVMHGEEGTARGSKIKGVTMAGKTGTAQNPHGENHSWFVGFAPADDPQIVACVIVENAGHGSDHAAPAVRKILKTYLEKHNLLNKEILIVEVN